MRKLIFAQLWLACIYWAISPLPVLGQSSGDTETGSQKSTVAPLRQIANSPIKRVGYRMANWRTMHGDSGESTIQLVATLQKMGCEVRQESHGDHVDIAFRCPSWKNIVTENQQQSQQWQQWLIDNEFETVLLNPSADIKLPTVKVRLANWKTVHAGDAIQAKSLQETYELIGCESAIEDHGDHLDVRFRCLEWSTLALANGRAAHVWEAWLRKSGFETEHDHTYDGVDAHAGHDHSAAGGHSHGGHAGHDHHDHDH